MGVDQRLRLIVGGHTLECSGLPGHALTRSDELPRIRRRKPGRTRRRPPNPAAATADDRAERLYKAHGARNGRGMPLDPGLTAMVIVEVGEADTGVRPLGSGTVPVLGKTPPCARSVRAGGMRRRGPPKTRRGLHHGRRSRSCSTMSLRARSEQTITAEATLEKIVGRKLFFTTSVRDGRGLIAAGKVVRVVVETAAVPRRSAYRRPERPPDGGIRARPGRTRQPNPSLFTRRESASVSGHGVALDPARTG